MLVSATTATVASAAPAPTTRVGPLSGIAYEFLYSCPAEALQFVVPRFGPLPQVEVVVTMLTGGSPRATFTKGFSGTSTIPVISGYGIGAEAGAYVATEQFAGAGSPVEFARGEWNCPDYGSLARSAFVPITPARVLDTRPLTATNFAGPTPAARSSITIPATAFPAMPAGAVAASLNVTLVEAAAPGFVQVLPAGQTPGESSNVNAQAAGQTVANAAITPLGADRAITVYHHSGGHVLVDVNGYFVAAPGPTRAGRLTSFAAARVLDTRGATQIGYVGAKPAAGATIHVPLVGRSPVPAGQAAAAVVNVTATGSDAPGFVQAAASGSLVPGEASVLNLTAPNQTVAALAIVPLAPDGSFDLYTLAGTDLAVDVVGWFSDDTAPSSRSGQFVALAPERILDTRYTSPVHCCGVAETSAAGSQFHDLLAGRWLPGAEFHLPLSGITAEAASVFTNLTAVDGMQPGFVQVGASKALERGATSNVNVTAARQIVANAAVVPLGTASWPFDGIAIYTTSGGNAVVDLAGYFAK